MYLIVEHTMYKQLIMQLTQPRPNDNKKNRFKGWLDQQMTSPNP